MRPRPRRLSLLPWTAAANTVALLVMFAHAKQLRPPQPPAAPGAQLLQATPPTAPKPPDQTTIKQQVLHHLPGPRIPALPRPDPPWPDQTRLPQPDASADTPGPLGPAPTPDLLRGALDLALGRSTGELPHRGRLVPLLLPRVGEQPDLAAHAGPVLVAAADAADPGDGFVRLAPNDPLFRQPHDVRGWWQASGRPALWLQHGGGGRTVLWFAAGVRAGWLAGRHEAVDLLRNALDDARLAGG